MRKRYTIPPLLQLKNQKTSDGKADRRLSVMTVSNSHLTLRALVDIFEGCEITV